jgi:HK97 family phage prohead protease
MPLPKPKKDETKKDFIDRCMSNPTVCNQLWKDKDKASARDGPAIAEREVRTLPKEQAQVRVAGEDDKKIVGYASVFYDGTPGTEFQLWDDLVERIMPTAFDAAIARGDDVRGLFNHDPSLVLGRTTSGTMQLRTDKKGLSYSIAPADTTVAQDVVGHIERGDVDGSSFAFRATDVDVRLEDGVEIREIRGVELFDVGPVTYPAYEAATSGYRTREQVAVECRAALAAKGAVEPVVPPKPAEDEESRTLKDWARSLTTEKN